MEKHKDRDCVYLPSGLYNDEEHSISLSSLTSPSDFDDQDNEARSPWIRSSLSFLKIFVRQLVCVLLSILASLVPTFISRYHSSTKDVGSARRLSQTAYLDGLRGVACVAVYLHHFVINWFPALRNTYGDSPKDRYFFQLPIVRVILDGRAAVAIFFVVSGYAISYSALSKLHNDDAVGVLNTLSSSTFRRCMRIYIPCAVATFICMLLQYNGLFTQDPLKWNNVPPRFDKFSAQISDWRRSEQIFMYPFLNVEGVPYSPPYNGHLWTIPLEIRGSFVVYGTVLAAAKSTPFWRMAFFVVWACYLYHMGKWDLFLFVGGVVLANFDIPRHAAAAKKAKQDPTPEGESLLPLTEAATEQMTVDLPEQKLRWPKLQKLRKTNSAQIRRVIRPILKVLRAMIPYVLFVLALWLLSFPHVHNMEWAYRAVPDRFEDLHEFFTKKTQGIRIIGSMLLAFSLSLSASKLTPTYPSKYRFLRRFRNMNLQSLFTNSFSQYLGRISFGFYLMHGPVLFCIGTRFFLNSAWAAFDTDRDLGAYVRKFILAVLVNTVAIFWVGDVFTRVIDERTIRWAAWVAKFMSRKPKQVLGGCSMTGGINSTPPIRGMAS
ncbi:hypothetical protein IFR05_006754 [Cadophora sp. M221]|nr:hypothetical protein IFR05_006754 [Cadophora sp. M221]